MNIVTTSFSLNTEREKICGCWDSSPGLHGHNVEFLPLNYSHFCFQLFENVINLLQYHLYGTRPDLVSGKHSLIRYNFFMLVVILTSICFDYVEQLIFSFVTIYKQNLRTTLLAAYTKIT